MGKLGLKPWELERYTLGEFFNAMDGLAELEAAANHRARLIARYALGPYAKEGTEFKDIMRIPLIDDLEEMQAIGRPTARVRHLTPEQIEQWHAGTLEEEVMP